MTWYDGNISQYLVPGSIWYTYYEMYINIFGLKVHVPIPLQFTELLCHFMCTKKWINNQLEWIVLFRVNFLDKSRNIKDRDE